MKHLAEIIKQIEVLKSNIENAKQNLKNSNDFFVQINCKKFIKEWQESIRVLELVLEIENKFENK